MRFAKSNRGVGLIEVLVALLIIAIGVLGAVALQSRAVQAGMEAYQRAQALLLVEDMVERIKNNRAFATGCYLIPGYLGTGASSVPSGCNTLADVDIAGWHALLQGASETQPDNQKVGGILGARGCIVSEGVGRFRVSVAWQGLSKLDNQNTDTCANGTFGDEGYRRVVGVSFRLAKLN